MTQTLDARTITAHGATYTLDQAAARQAEIAELNALYGESDGRVTLANALTAAVAALPAPKRATAVKVPAARTPRRRSRGERLASVYAISPKGAFRKFEYRDWDTMEAGLDRLVAKGYSIVTSG